MPIPLVRSPLTKKRKARSLAAPALTRSAAGTHKRNRREWVQIALFLADRTVNP